MIFPGSHTHRSGPPAAVQVQENTDHSAEYTHPRSWTPHDRHLQAGHKGEVSFLGRPETAPSVPRGERPTVRAKDSWEESLLHDVHRGYRSLDEAIRLSEKKRDLCRLSAAQLLGGAR